MYLAIREMRFAKMRYSLIAVIMLLVSFLVLFVSGLARGLAYDNAASIQNMDADYFIMEQDSDHRFARSRVGEQTLAQSGSIAGRENVQPLGVGMTTVAAEGTSRKLDVTLLAVSPQGWLMPEVTEGKAIGTQSEGLVLADDKLKDAGVRLGTAIVDQATGMKWTVGGFVANESYSHAPAVYLSERDWRLRMQHAADGTDGSTVYSAIAVKTDKKTAGRLAAALPNAEIVAKSAAVAAIPGYKEEQGSLMMMTAFLYAISALVLAVFFYVVTIQKRSQFGILKAIGTSTAYLARGIALQVALLCAGSLLTGVILIRAVEALLPGGMPFRLEPSVLALTCGAFAGMALAGSLLSVWKVTRIDALEAIGGSAA